MKKHRLDILPLSPDGEAFFVNEPWLIDTSITEQAEMPCPSSKQADDAIRVYLPLDLNKEAILRRLRAIIEKYGEATEENEFDYSFEVSTLISQIEIYDQIWCMRHALDPAEHSVEAKQLVKEFLALLESIPDGCAEFFPFETIDELNAEYLSH